MAFNPASDPGIAGHEHTAVLVDEPEPGPNARAKTVAATDDADDDDDEEIIPKRRKTSDVVTRMEMMMSTMMIHV